MEAEFKQLEPLGSFRHLRILFCSRFNEGTVLGMHFKFCYLRRSQVAPLS